MVRRRGVWPVIRRIWITTGITATVVFVTWSLWAYRASSAAHAAMVSDEQVDVVRGAHHWTFLPRAAVLPVGLLFFPGSARGSGRLCSAAPPRCRSGLPGRARAGTAPRRVRRRRRRRAAQPRCHRHGVGRAGLALGGRLPPGTRHVRIDGGNHSQFGAYGFQPGDWPATISRTEQQRQTLEAVLRMLREVSGG
jgi:hypothetical protein